ncbi:MAG TPA: bifunctional transaldolase/phosoglucose isomerase [Methylomirabilota bacterium]|nr:bifunctional transaldolase/phosoglucose isomerase [Methylomirabilota bacterium]
MGGPVTLPIAQLPPALDAAVDAALREWAAGERTRRLWAADPGLWTGRDEASWLGWLTIPGEQLRDVDRLRGVQDAVRRDGFSHALLLGMGGSSLCPEVLRAIFGRVAEFPDLLVLDSTDPAQVRAVEARLDLARTLVIVSSKSGSTLEPNIFKDYFLERVRRVVGPERAARHFVAITDPGSALERTAEAEGFREVFLGVPSIGGRYSALSAFGLVPAAAMGLDLERLLEPAADMAARCGAAVPAAENPGVALGTVMGVLGREGRDKVTIVASPRLGPLGAWLEQLLAESTGKAGRGLIPVDREPLGLPEVYGADRLFVYLRLESEPDPAQDRATAALAAAGQPLVRLPVAEPYRIGAEFFRWEFATAVAGALLGINPFDQPDVEASKEATRTLTAEYERTGRLPAEAALVEADGIRVFADPRNAAALAGADPTLAGVLGAHLARVRPGDYVALLAYLPVTEPHEAALQACRLRIRDRCRVATCLGFGPRFLHSTGQAYKGGPNTGVFLQLTCDDGADLAIPGRRYTFGVVKAAQARGDLAVLAERGRRALRLHLGTDVAAGLGRLAQALERALG